MEIFWDPVTGDSENMHQELSLSSTMMHDLLHTHQPRLQPGRGTKQQRRHPLHSDHAILIHTNAFKYAIRENQIHTLNALSKQFIRQMETNLEFLKHDHSDLKASYQTAVNVINSHTTMSTPLPSSPLNKQTQQPHASFKDPKLDTPNWSGKSCDFYPWLSAVLNRFTLTRAEKVVKVAFTMQAILLAKQGPFNNITDWDIFRVKFI